MAKLQFFFDICKFCHVFLCFLRCFIHFNADLNDFCKECTKKTAAQVRVLLGERCVRKNANAVHDWGIYCLVVILRMRRCCFVTSILFTDLQFPKYPSKKENYKWYKDCGTYTNYHIYFSPLMSLGLVSTLLVFYDFCKHFITCKSICLSCSD